MSQYHPSFRLSDTPVHLGLGATVVPQEQFTGEPAWYERDAAHNAADESRAVSSPCTLSASLGTPGKSTPRGEGKLVPTRRQVKLARAIPSAVIHVMDGTHMCCGTEPETFAETLVEACQLVARRAQRLPNGLDSRDRGSARAAYGPR